MVWAGLGGVCEGWAANGRAGRVMRVRGGGGGGGGGGCVFFFFFKQKTAYEIGQ